MGTEKGSNTGDFVIASVNMMPGSYAIKASTPTSTNFWLNCELINTKVYSNQQNKGSKFSVSIRNNNIPFLKTLGTEKVH